MIHDIHQWPQVWAIQGQWQIIRFQFSYLCSNLLKSSITTTEPCLQDPAEGRAIYHTMQCLVRKKLIVSRQSLAEFKKKESWISFALWLQEHNEWQQKDASQPSWLKSERVCGRAPMPSGTLKLKLLWDLWLRLTNILFPCCRSERCYMWHSFTILFHPGWATIPCSSEMMSVCSWSPWKIQWPKFAGCDAKRFLLLSGFGKVYY